jgi:hypothetical protein
MPSIGGTGNAFIMRGAAAFGKIPAWPVLAVSHHRSSNDGPSAVANKRSAGGYAATMGRRSSHPPSLPVQLPLAALKLL